MSFFFFFLHEFNTFMQVQIKSSIKWALESYVCSHLNKLHNLALG